ncbi:MAG: ArnT family glycosyltransferase [Anaerolineae bacterium]
MLKTHWQKHNWIIVGVLLILWGLLLFRINEPFYGHHESGLVWMGSAIRMFNQYGPEATNFLPIRTPGPSTPETGLYYLHHPPLIVWFSAISTYLFGYYQDTGAPYELSLRMVGIIATMLTLPIFYALARKLTSTHIALIGSILYALAPATVYFGRLPYYDMVVMPVILAFAYVFTRWMKAYRRSDSLVLALLGILAMWVAWAAGFFFFVFGIIALLYGKKAHRIDITIIGVVVGLATLAIPLLYQSLRPDAVNQLITAISARTSNELFFSENERFTVVEFIANYIRHMFLVVTVATTILGLIGFGFLITERKTLKNVVLLSLFFGPLIFMLTARSSFHFHDWYKLHFLPAFSISAALVIVKVWHLKPTGIRKYGKPFIVAILICSAVIQTYWTVYFHQRTFNPLTRQLAAELPLHTAQDDLIGVSLNIFSVPVEYYAYRNILWGVSAEGVEEFYQEEETVDLKYLLCEPFNNDGFFAEFDYVLMLDETCRLYHITKS